MSERAAEPFHDFSLPSERVILKSSDGVEFRLYMTNLALSSPFFSSMFSLPQACQSNNVGSSAIQALCQYSDAQIVDVSEASTTLDALLRLVYPISPPRFPGISDTGDVTDAKALVDAINPVLAAAVKYEMDQVVKKLFEKLLVAAETPLADGTVVDDTLALRLYALACRCHLKEEARLAAHATLKGRVTGVFIDDLRNITTVQYFQLLKFRKKISDAVDKILPVKRVPTLVTNYDNLKCEICTNHWDYRSYASWYLKFLDAGRPLLLESPRSDLAWTSAFLENVFAEARKCIGPPCKAFPGRWHVISSQMKEKIALAISENDIDLSEI